MPAGVCRASGEGGRAEVGRDRYRAIDPKQLERGHRAVWANKELWNSNSVIIVNPKQQSDVAQNAPAPSCLCPSLCQRPWKQDPWDRLYFWGHKNTGVAQMSQRALLVPAA